MKGYDNSKLKKPHIYTMYLTSPCNNCTECTVTQYDIETWYKNFKWKCGCKESTNFYGGLVENNCSNS